MLNILYRESHWRSKTALEVISLKFSFDFTDLLEDWFSSLNPGDGVRSGVISPHSSVSWHRSGKNSWLLYGPCSHGEQSFQKAKTSSFDHQIGKKPTPPPTPKLPFLPNFSCPSPGPPKVLSPCPGH